MREYPATGDLSALWYTIIIGLNSPGCRHRFVCLGVVGILRRTKKKRTRRLEVVTVTDYSTVIQLNNKDNAFFFLLSFLALPCTV